MLTSVEGIRVGHWTDETARTGCTVVLAPPATVASGEVRGGAPATRDFELLSPLRTVDNIDAVVISGGSAFGLAAADGVAEWLEQHNRGYETPAGRVPIVVGMSLFDLGVGDASVRPTAANGRQAAENASTDARQSGPIGAGTGAAVDKWHGEVERRKSSGLGTAVHRDADLVVAALIAVNAAGAVDNGETEAAIRAGKLRAASPAQQFGNTTIGVVATNARLPKLECHLVAQAAHDGFARAITPSHLSTDGDAVVAMATQQVDASLDWVRALTQIVVADAIRSAVSGATAQ